MCPVGAAGADVRREIAACLFLPPDTVAPAALLFLQRIYKQGSSFAICSGARAWVRIANYNPRLSLYEIIAFYAKMSRKAAMAL
jgi:hypothetical protein